MSGERPQIDPYISRTLIPRWKRIARFLHRDRLRVYGWKPGERRRNVYESWVSFQLIQFEFEMTYTSSSFPKSTHIRAESVSCAFRIKNDFAWMYRVLASGPKASLSAFRTQSVRYAFHAESALTV